MTWIPQWRITVDSTVYTNVLSVNVTLGRIDIDRQCQPGYARMEIVNTGTSMFDVDVTDSIKLEVKDSSGDYVDIFGGTVSDFTVGVRSPDEFGFFTVGTILAVGNLAKLPKSIFTGSLSEDLDGAQIVQILDTVTSLTTGEVDAGRYQMVSRNADPVIVSNLVNQIATSGIGQIYEDNLGRVCFADADHRTTYLAANGYTELNAVFAYPNGVKTLLQIGKIRNSLTVNYGTGLGSTLTDSDPGSIATYDLYSYKFDSSIKNLADMQEILSRELNLRATPITQLDSITFRLDNPEMSDSLRDNLLNIFFGEPVKITNLPSSIFNSEFNGFVEGWAFNATPTYVDLKIYASPVFFSIVPLQWETVTPDTLIWNGVNATLIWSNATGDLV